MSKNVVISALGNPECPHPPLSMGHTCGHLLTRRPWVRQGPVSGRDAGSRPERLPCLFSGQGWVQADSSRHTPLPVLDAVEWVLGVWAAALTPWLQVPGSQAWQ